MKLDTPGWLMLAVIAFLLYQKYGNASTAPAASGGALPNPNATGATGSQGLDLSVQDGW